MAALLDDVKIVSDDEVFGANLAPDFSDGFPDEFEQDLPSDAMGAPSATARVRGRLKPPGDTINAATRRRLQGEFELYLELLNGILGMRCEHCAEANEPHLSNLAKRLTNICARYPDMVDKLIAGGILPDSIALIAAGAPIIRQTVGHHVTHTIRYADDEEPEGVNLASYTQRVG